MWSWVRVWKEEFKKPKNTSQVPYLDRIWHNSTENNDNVLQQMKT